ncbi:MAG: metallo-beta-lactamase superfamily hydrolase [Candidatus Woesebacteria bacterium GW2011_GWF1_31_35]|nr:MAG: metallo-beta-lactamase superfamily hydrolase [Candidatus Woesebacteria bacterium GW2011_GWF1_31_35]KKP23392.1 MAG: Metallo-beta-lactamase family protein [Candidatus Woesebacteria bacterium GW2011_GWC1_30_29]KKP25204.1 MAG: Metallo-beta-lactamase family protein [Candidatus Woesebacteria bacterium GW2011_GWD1_31_12]KKP27651.1 MAG: Metallo-beta-lactamase family protein [Candidatus Woesebacteria bacterium GW2011_GWB1_31_29]KKP34292.1 MAG: Metallo-beta-lactamase family protein [Candidatus Wo
MTPILPETRDTNMAYEIDYIPVGDGEKSGDAILLRFGNLIGPRSEQTVVVIDGGFKDSGEKIVEHLSTYYGTTEVDLVVSTHPDADHASGLSVVLENCTVTNLLIHKPWEHAEDIKSLFKDGRITASGLEEKLEKSLQHASDLEAMAREKGIKIVEPFQGVTGFSNVMLVLGPSQEYYEGLLALFRSTPSPIESLAKLLAPVQKAAEEVINWLEDTFEIDLLNDDDDTTSAENNSSAVILFTIDGHKLLFTGDAGKTGLLSAAEYAEGQGIALTDLSFLDVPHHGSKRNLSSKVLAKIKAGTAFVSAAEGSPKHPAKKVTNALKKHGARVYVNNKGNTIQHGHNAPDRSNWGPAPEEIFHSRVEE